MLPPATWQGRDLQKKEIGYCTWMTQLSEGVQMEESGFATFFFFFFFPFLFFSRPPMAAMLIGGDR